jgi:hypothetical protein
MEGAGFGWIRPALTAAQLESGKPLRAGSPIAELRYQNCPAAEDLPATRCGRTPRDPQRSEIPAPAIASPVRRNPERYPGWAKSKFERMPPPRTLGRSGSASPRDRERQCDSRSPGSDRDHRPPQSLQSHRQTVRMLRTNSKRHEGRKELALLLDLV